MPSDIDEEARMIKVQKDIEISVRLKNQPGAFEQLLDSLTSCGIEILASNSHRASNWMLALLITDDAYSTRRVLEASGLDCWSDSVIRVDCPGRGKVVHLGAQLRTAGIRIVYSYLSMLPSSEGSDHSCVVFKTTDDARALRILRENFPDSHRPPTGGVAGQGEGWGIEQNQPALRR